MTFTANLWIYPGVKGPWHFISLPREDAARLKDIYGARARSWGSFRVEARIGKTQWKTSIFPDRKSGTYILPVKADVRKREHLGAGNTVRVAVTVM